MRLLLKTLSQIHQQYRTMLLSKQAVLSVYLICALTGCHNHNLAPREIETISKNSSLTYSAKIRYNRALGKLDAANIAIKTITGKETLHIHITGEAMSPMYAEAFTFAPRTIHVHHNTCKIIKLEDSSHYQAVPLQICFINHVLMLDPNPSDKEYPYQSSIFYPSPLWLIAEPLTGITTYGVARLRNASLAIKIHNDKQLEKQ